jgi:hypothetical protein
VEPNRAGEVAGGAVAWGVCDVQCECRACVTARCDGVVCEEDEKVGVGGMNVLGVSEGGWQVGVWEQ